MSKFISYQREVLREETPPSSRMLFSMEMVPKTYHVQADWDPEAGVWVATSEDVPGLATEASTIELLAKKLRTLIPELLEANRLLSAWR